MYIIVLLNYVYVVHGCYIGLKPVWVPGIISQKLQEMELGVEREVELARKLFAVIFKEDLENRPNDLCFTKADWKNCLTSSIAGHLMYIYGVQQNLYSFV